MPPSRRLTPRSSRAPAAWRAGLKLERQACSNRKRSHAVSRLTDIESQVLTR